MSTLPQQLDPEALRNLAITVPDPIDPATGIRASQAPNPMLAAPTQPPQVSAPLSLPQAPMPNLGIPAPQAVRAPRGTIQGDTDERSRMLSTGAGEDQIYSRVTGSQFGQNHPILGKILGGLGQGIAKLGDIGLSAVAPALAINLPGTEYHHNMQIHQLNRQIGDETAEGEKQAQTADIQSQIPLREAQTQEAQTHAADQPAIDQAQIAEHNAQAASLLHPQAKTDFEAWQQQNPEKPIEEWLKALNQNRNVQPKEQLQQQLIAAQNSGDTATAKKLQQQLKDIDPMGEQRVTIQQQTANNAQNRTADAKTEREFTYVRNKWDKDLQTYSTQNEKLSEASQMVGNGAMGAALGSVKSLSGLAGGQGSGVRITQAELNSIAHARGFKGDFDAFLQQFGDGNKLTPEQVQSLKGIISDVQKIAGAKEAVINKALDDLNEARDPATIRRIDSQVRHVLMGAQ